MNLPERRNLAAKPELVAPPEHIAHILGPLLQHTGHELGRAGYAVAAVSAEDAIRVREREVVACQREDPVVVSRMGPFEECLRGQEADIDGGDEGEGFGIR